MQAEGLDKQLQHLSFSVLSRGVGAQFLLQIPVGAVNFAVLEVCGAQFKSLLISSFTEVQSIL